MSITGDWLAGFIDGEGSFNISNHAGSCQPRFSLKLRDDDTDILKEIHKFLGVGTVRASKTCPTTSKYYTSNAHSQIRFDITGRDNVKLIEILDKFPLRSKKSRDYKIWKEAVQIYAANIFTRWSDAELKKNRNDKLRELKVQLEDVRKYNV